METDRQKYLLELESQNAYCDCEPIRPLKEREKKIRKLEKECDFFGNNVDLENPSSEDRGFLEDYLKKTGKLEGEVNTYSLIISKGLKQGVLFTKPLKKGFTGIYCTFCSQQIEVVETN